MVIPYSMQMKLRIHQIRDPYFQNYGTMFLKTVVLWEEYESYVCQILHLRNLGLECQLQLWPFNQTKPFLSEI